MTTLAVRNALETALAGVAPALATAWENKAFTPPAASVPYQRVDLLFATPDNPEYGRAHTELGIFQVSLFYPLQAGSSAAATRAELLRTTFFRGASFTSSGVVVTITRTPEIGRGMVDGARGALPVKIRFSAFISS